MNSLPVAELCRLIVAKHDVLAQLVTISKRQLNAIAGDDTDRLLSLLATKQGLLSELDGLERELAPFRLEDPQARVWPAPDMRRRAQAVAARANQLLAELIELEQSAARELTASRDAAAAQLAQANRAFAAHQAYVAPTNVGVTSGLNLMSET